MIRRPPRSTRTDTLFPYTTLFRSCASSLPSTNLTYLIADRGAPYKRDSFQAVGTIAFEFGSVIVAKDSPYQTLAVLIAEANARPGSVRRSAARRVGTEFVIPCNSRGSQEHLKTKNTIKPRSHSINI